MVNHEAIITIVIPTYKAMSDLPECVDSIIDNLGDLIGHSVLVLIQDGYSKDGIVEYIEALNLSGVTIRSEPDSGIYDAMNKATRNCRTPWTYFLGADDRLLPHFKDALQRLNNTNDIYYANVNYLSDDRKYDGAFSKLKLMYRNICHQAIFYPTHILISHPFQTMYQIQADWASNIHFIARYNFHYLDYIVAIFNDSGGTSSNYRDSAFEANKNSIVRAELGYGYYLFSLSAPLAAVVYQTFFRPRRKPRRFLGHDN